MLQRIADEYGFRDVRQLVVVSTWTLLAGVASLAVLVAFMAVVA